MVDRYPRGEPQDHEGQAAFFSDLESMQRSARMEKLATAHSLLGKARGLDDELMDKGLTKKFISKSGGDPAGGKYPFPHLRVKLKPKNRAQTDIRVIALRYPSEIGFQRLHYDKLYIAYEDQEGEHMFYLSVGQYSRLDPRCAFVAPGEGTVFEPNVDGLSRVDDHDLLALESLLGDNPDFEPDLQPHNPDIAA